MPLSEIQIEVLRLLAAHRDPESYLVTIHETILPFGAVIWAAVEKSPGFTPERLIAEIRRNSCYPAAEWRALLSSEPLDPKAI